MSCFNHPFDDESELGIPEDGFYFLFDDIKQELEDVVPREELRRASLIMWHGDYLDSLAS